jgi:hypothetical protein
VLIAHSVLQDNWGSFGGESLGPVQGGTHQRALLLLLLQQRSSSGEGLLAYIGCSGSTLVGCTLSSRPQSMLPTWLRGCSRPYISQVVAAAFWFNAPGRA